MSSSPLLLYGSEDVRREGDGATAEDGSCQGRSRLEARKKPTDVEASPHPLQRALVPGRMARAEETPALGRPVCAGDHREAPDCGSRVEQRRIGACHIEESRVEKKCGQNLGSE